MAEKKLTAEEVNELCDFLLTGRMFADSWLERIKATRALALQALAQPEGASITQQFERLVVEQGAHAALAGMSLEAQVALANVLLQKGAQPEAQAELDAMVASAMQRPGVKDLEELHARTVQPEAREGYEVAAKICEDRAEYWREQLRHGHMDDLTTGCFREARHLAAAIRALSDTEAREGYVLMPVELNAKMLRSAMKRAYGETVYENMDSEALGYQQQYMREIYAAMIRAAQDCAKPPNDQTSG